MKQHKLEINTSGRGMVDITHDVAELVATSDITSGLCHIFCQHTSASLILCENADPTVKTDLEAFLKRLVPDGDTLFQHTAEGIDDMPAHIRTILTQSSLSIPITDSHLALGTWQGLYLWEHRFHSYTRRLIVTLVE